MCLYPCGHFPPKKTWESNEKWSLLHSAHEYYKQNKMFCNKILHAILRLHVLVKEIFIEKK